MESIHFRTDKKDLFFQLCEYRGVNPSDLLRSWVESFVAEKEIIKEFTEQEILQGKNHADLEDEEEFTAARIKIVYDESGTTYFTAIDGAGNETVIEVKSGLTKEQIESYTAGEIFNLPWQGVLS